MAKATEIYSSRESRAYIQAETTAMTANVTTMKEILLTGSPSIGENIFADNDVKHGVGRTAKKRDVVVVTKGQEKEISFQCYLDNVLYMNLLENGAGKEDEAVGGEMLILYNHTPASVGNGEAFTDFTATLTFAWVPPFASEAQVFPGCTVDKLKFAMAQGTEGGRALIDVTLKTRDEILTDQETPASVVAGTKSTKTIYDLCTTAQVNSIDVQLHSFEITHEFNHKHKGMVTDGGASAVGKNIPNLGVSGVVVCLVDSNLVDAYKLPRSGTCIPLSFSDGTDFFFTIADANVTGDVQPQDEDDIQIWNIPWIAKADTSGNLLEEQVG